MLNQIFNNSSEYFKRFNLSFIFSVMFFLLCVCINHKNYDNYNNTISVCIGIIGYNFLISIGLRLFCESHKKTLTVYYTMAFILFLVIYFYFFPLFGRDLDNIIYNKLNSNFIVFFPFFSFLFIFTSPFFHKQSNNDEISTFNYNTASQMFFSILGSLVLWIGGAVILFSINNLLKINISSEIYFDLFLFSFCIFLPIFFLSGVPKNFNEIKTQYPKSIKYIVFYISVPIIVVFSTIFILYMIKISIQNNFQFFREFFNVFYFYSFAGILIYIMSHPFRNENKLMIFFYKNFFRFLIFPTILAIIMIFPYIIKYGFTPWRYLGLIFLIWLCISIVVKFLSKQNDIRNILLATTLFVFVLSLNPLNLGNVSEMTQIHILKRILKENNLLVNEKLQKSNIKISEKDTRRIKDISKYLIESRMIKSLQNLIGDKVDIKNEIIKKDYWLSKENQEKIFNILTSKEEKE